MSTEKEYIKQVQTESGVTHEHHSFLDTIMEKIEDVIDNMDTDFPLSGGIEHPVRHNRRRAEQN